MNTLIHQIIAKRRQAREAKKQELKKSRILRCINNSDIKYEDLIPIGDEEYDRVVSALEEKVNREIGEEPRYLPRETSGSTESEYAKQERSADNFVSAMGFKYPRNFRRNGLPNIFAWREIVDSMKNRVRDAYYIKNRPCGKCGEDNTIFFCFRSSDESWKELCGREGYMLICPDCLTILGFVPYFLN